MSRISDLFARLDGRKALLSFVTAGDPNLEHTVPAMHALVAGGANLIELGIPFSDPEADGPAIQAASERALAAGVTLRDVMDCVRTFRQQDATTPVVLMGYLNSVLAYDDFAATAKEAGVDGLIMVNLPPEQAREMRAQALGDELDLIFMVAPTTTEARLQTVLQQARGFVYYVSFKGITGADRLEVDEVAQRVAHIQSQTDLPVCVGFGIKNAETARAVGAVADGVVVGTALVNTMQQLGGDVQACAAALHAQVSELREALDP